jgi:hypothetical protein
MPSRGSRSGENSIIYSGELVMLLKLRQH